MTKSIFIFLITFALGAVAAVVVRTALHEPSYEPPPPAARENHDGHGGGKVSSPPESAPVENVSKAVNTVCAICGMDVDPRLPTLEYHGKRIGFGCKMCAPKFKAEPDKYGPYYLRNEVIKR